MALVPANGIRLNVEIAGAGQPLVMLHGFTGDLSTWDCMASVLQDRYSTVRVDLIGHGKSDAPEDEARYSMERCVEDLVTLSDRLGISEAIWMGYSMGGRVALCLGVSVPERCRALILEGASGGIEDVKDREARISADRALARRIESEGMESFVERWESQPLFESQVRLDEETRMRLRRKRLCNRGTGLANSLRGMGTGAQPSVYHRLSGFRRPALFLAGENDTKFVALAQKMSALCPDGQYEEIPNAGHCAHLENPDHFRKSVGRFLESVEPEPIGGPAPGARERSVG